LGTAASHGDGQRTAHGEYGGATSTHRHSMTCRGL